MRSIDKLFERYFPAAKFFFLGRTLLREGNLGNERCDFQLTLCPWEGVLVTRISSLIIRPKISYSTRTL